MLYFACTTTRYVLDFTFSAASSVSSGSAVLEANTFCGALFFTILAAGFGLGFMDGAPGMTPGYDVFSQPGPKDANYFIGHVGAHAAGTVLPLMYLFIVPAAEKNKKKA